MFIKFLFFSFSFYLFRSFLTPQALPFNAADRHGKWQLLQPNVGISAMHMQLLRTNKVVIFDRTDFGKSNLSFPDGRCRYDPSDTVLQTDCTAHSILYDVCTNDFRPLMVQTDTWCSSGTVLPNGTLVQTGGYNDGDRTMRTFTPCDDENCDWIEFPNYLAQRRWYASNQLLPDGRIIVVGGRRQYNYEFFSPNLEYPPKTFRMKFLRETRDSDENNLYPFLHLLPDGNLFILANKRSVLFDHNHNNVVKEFQELPGEDTRNYPSSGSSVLLPLDENNVLEPEVMVCGGAPKGSFSQAKRGRFARACSTCGRLKVSRENPSWEMEQMPTPRVMGDMILLPTSDVLIINGAELGTAGWELARSPNTRPIIYTPSEQAAFRFSVMAPSPRPRMYHSSAILLNDGRILVGGSNPHIYYNFTGVEFPTDLSLEAFYPPYLSTSYESIKPFVQSLDKFLGYGKRFQVRFKVEELIETSVVTVIVIAPPFTTHSFGMNQRMVVLKMVELKSAAEARLYDASVVGPSTAEIAPPGYYLLFVVHARIPSSGVWVKIG